MSATLDIFFPYKARTGDIVVRVAASYLGDQSDPARQRWFWSYHIRIENHGEGDVQLLSRRWIITDGRGGRHRVEGEGVVGEQPIISPGGAYDYVSGCPLDTPSGAMEGAYHLVDAASRTIEAKIPRFQLTGATVSG